MDHLLAASGLSRCFLFISQQNLSRKGATMRNVLWILLVLVTITIPGCQWAQMPVGVYRDLAETKSAAQPVGAKTDTTVVKDAFRECVEKAFTDAKPFTSALFETDLSDVELVYGEPLPKITQDATAKAGAQVMAYTTRDKVNVQERLRQRFNRWPADQRQRNMHSIMVHELSHAAQCRLLGYDNLNDWSAATAVRLRGLGWKGDDENLLGICAILIEGQSYGIEQQMLNTQYTVLNESFRTMLIGSSVARRYAPLEYIELIKSDESLDQLVADVNELLPAE